MKPRKRRKIRQKSKMLKLRPKVAHKKARSFDLLGKSWRHAHSPEWIKNITSKYDDVFGPNYLQPALKNSLFPSISTAGSQGYSRSFLP
jgi:hypothetical protein